MAKKKSVKKPKTEKPKDELQEASELLKKIEKAEKACQDHAAAMQIAKEEYKLAKEAYGNSVVELRRLCRARKEKMPLFDSPKPADSLPSEQPTASEQQPACECPRGGCHETDEDGDCCKCGEPNVTTKPCSWRELPLDTLTQYGARDVAVEKLAEAIGAEIGCGGFADYLEKHATFWGKECGLNANYRDEVADALGRLRGALETPVAA